MQVSPVVERSQAKTFEKLQVKEKRPPRGRILAWGGGRGRLLLTEEHRWPEGKTKNLEAAE